MNPFVNAAKAAWAELSTDAAIAFYFASAEYCAIRAAEDSILTVTVAVWAIATAGRMAYEAGALFRSQIAEGYNATATTETESKEPAAIAAAPPIIATLPLKGGAIVPYIEVIVLDPIIAALPPAKLALSPAPRRRNQTEEIHHEEPLIIAGALITSNGITNNPGIDASILDQPVKKAPKKTPAKKTTKKQPARKRVGGAPSRATKAE